MKDFVNWLIGEMNSRGWSNSELARRAGVVHSTISLVLSSKSSPGPDLCLGLARAFRMPPEEVFRIAGLLPALPGDGTVPQYTRLIDCMNRLSVKDREEVLQYALFRYEKANTPTSSDDDPGDDGADE
jgi:transcriptional regulator with XRE-family HTH domain